MTKIFEAIEKANKKRIKPPSGPQPGSVRFSNNGDPGPRNGPEENRSRNPWAQQADNTYQDPYGSHGNPSWGAQSPSHGNGYYQPPQGAPGYRPMAPQGGNGNHHGYYGPPPAGPGPYYYNQGDSGQFQPPPGSGQPPRQPNGGGYQTPPPNGGGSNQGNGGPGQPAPGQQPPPGGPGFVAGPVVRPVVGDLKLVRPLTILFQNISALLPDQASRSIMIMESRPNEGASTLALEFAKVCAIKLNKRVLLMDADQSRFDMMARYGAIPEMGWGEAVYHSMPLSQAVTQVGDSHLHYTQVASRQGLPPIAFDSVQMTGIMEELKKDFELILIQPPPGLISADGLLMARRVDGVILVVEAEKTRYQVVERVRDQLETNSARILGVILNKRRFPIPKFIYKYL